MNPAFIRQMSRMNGLKFVPGDMTTHWEALQDLPLPVLEAAVSHAQKSCVEFPTPFELRSFADLVRPHVAPIPAEEDRRRPLAKPLEITAPWLTKSIRVTDEWDFYCDTCQDSGWELLFCGPEDAPNYINGLSLWRCERPQAHLAHDWARKCGCYDTNVAIQRKLESQRKYAAERTKK